MITKAQSIIIQEICSIQHESLSNILIEVNLGTDDDGEEYEDIFEELGITRKDIDKQLILTIHAFQDVKDKPEKLGELSDLDMVVFKHILYHFGYKWENKYPKALVNLWDKLFIKTIFNKINH